jgi:hypothetical protein
VASREGSGRGKTSGLDMDELDFYTRYLNEGNKGFLPLARAKRIMFGGLAVFSGLGMIMSFSDVAQGYGMLVFFMVAVVFGSTGILMSNRLFPDNRCMFVIYGFGSVVWSWVFLILGVSFIIHIFGDSRIGAIVILIQCVSMGIIIANILKRISRKTLLKQTLKSKAGITGGGALGGYIGGVLLPRLLEGKVSDAVFEIIAFCGCLAISIMMWFGVERLFQLYYATKFGIEVCDTWGCLHQRGMAAEKKKFDWGSLYCGVLCIVLYTTPFAGLYVGIAGLITAIVGKEEFNVWVGLIICVIGLLMSLVAMLSGQWRFEYFGMDPLF